MSKPYKITLREVEAALVTVRGGMVDGQPVDPSAYQHLLNARAPGRLGSGHNTRWRDAVLVVLRKHGLPVATEPTGDLFVPPGTPAIGRKP